jgi:hypothetical protein
MTTDILPLVLLGFKLFTLLGLGVYVVFAGIMVRQEQLMAKTLESQYEPVIRLFVLLHLVVAVGVFILGLILL